MYFKTYCNLKVFTVLQRPLPVPKRGSWRRTLLSESVMTGQGVTALNLKRENSDYV